MIRKGQVKGVSKGDILAQVHLFESLFGIAALEQVQAYLARMLAHKLVLMNAEGKRDV